MTVCMDELNEYSRMVDDYAWYNKGNIFEIAKTAQRLGRNYMEDITNRKMAMIPAYEGFIYNDKKLDEYIINEA